MGTTKMNEKIAKFLGVVLVLFALWRALPFATLVPTLIARKISFALLMGMIYLTTRPWKKANGIYTKVINSLFLTLGIISVGYLIATWHQLPFKMMIPNAWDVIFCTIVIFITLDMVRRKTGWPLVIITLVFILYVLAGLHVPIKILKHTPYTWGDTVFALGSGPRGIWGTPLGTIIDFVVLFIAFGSIFLTTGVLDYFLKLACFLTRRLRSGPAMVAVISSCLFGMISGSAAGNVSTTGNFTIPLMKKAGFPGETAGGIEVAASIGGQWMPPVMGASAFIMASLLGIPYLEVVKNGFIPALLYFLAVGVMVIPIAGKHDVTPLPEEEYSILFQTSLKEWIFSTLHVGIPVAVLLYYIIQGYSPSVAASYGILSLVAMTLLVRKKDQTLMDRVKQIYEGLEKAGMAILSVGLACAAAGIIVGCIVTTGAAIKFTALIVQASGGNLIIAILLVAVASFFLGMGAPVTASYLIVAIVSAGALVELGVPVLVAHLISFWYAIDSEVTPPVCISSYAAAGIAQSDPWGTAMQGWKAAKGLYIIPILVATTPIVPVTWGNASTYEIVMAIFSAALGLVSLSIFMERYFMRKLSYLENSIFAISTCLLFLPYIGADILGTIIFFVIVTYLYNRNKRSNQSPTISGNLV